MSVRPDLQVSSVTAQSIVDCVVTGQTVASVSNIHGGEIAAVYEIAFVDASHPSLVLKVYPDALHWKMQKEVHVVDLVENRLCVPVPRILFADDSKRLLGLDFLVMTKLNGSILGRLESSLASEQILSAYKQIGQLLREFHRIPMEAFGYIGPKGIWTAHSTNHAYLTHQFRGKLDQFTGRGGAAALAQRIAGYVAEREQLLHACTRPVLCHNDLHAGNLLAAINEGTVRLTGVLDFEGALAGDPLMDLAKALYYLGEGPKRALLQGYGDMGREHWHQTLDLYHLYFVLELWCWMAEIGNTQPLGKLASDLERFATT
jgi:aminoglycoside phosphotransferase (APT) family kinase protein